MQKDFKIAVIISGRGSNMQSLIEQASVYSISGVISNKTKAAGLEFARNAGLPTTACPRKSYSSLLEQKQAIYAATLKYKPDLICLAGYMQIVEEDFVKEQFGRILNIHPSLLPKFPGLDTHKRALNAGETKHGCSVQYLDVGVDTGPIIAQSKVSVESLDTEETLASRVLKQEHQIYPWVVSMIAGEKISLRSGDVVMSKATHKEALEKGFYVPDSVVLN